ncbi:MAG: hypothetical protein U1F33_08275 [Alphaproteobacteria bacterium]
MRELGSATSFGGHGGHNAGNQNSPSGHGQDSVSAGSGNSTMIAGGHDTSFLGNQSSSQGSTHHGNDTVIGGSGVPETHGGGGSHGPGTFSFDTQQAGGGHLLSSFAQNQSTVASSLHGPTGESTVSGGHGGSSAGGGTIISLDEKTTIKITNNTHH